MGVIVCDSTKSKDKNKPIVEANTKIDTDKNSTKETDKNTNNKEAQSTDNNLPKGQDINNNNNSSKKKMMINLMMVKRIKMLRIYKNKMKKNY